MQVQYQDEPAIISRVLGVEASKSQVGLCFSSYGIVTEISKQVEVESCHGKFTLKEAVVCAQEPQSALFRVPRAKTALGPTVGAAGPTLSKRIPATLTHHHARQLNFHFHLTPTLNHGLVVTQTDRKLGTFAAQTHKLSYLPTS
jgi:hypothetical protein